MYLYLQPWAPNFGGRWVRMPMNRPPPQTKLRGGALASIQTHVFLTVTLGPGHRQEKMYV